MPERPRGRERGEIKSGSGVNIKGQGLGTGPKGSKDGYAGRPSGAGPGGGSRPSGSSGGRNGGSMGGGNMRRSGRGGSPFILLIILAAAVLGGGGTGILNLLNGSGGGSVQQAQDSPYQQTYGTGHYAAPQTETPAANQADEDKVSLYDYINEMFGGDPYTYTEEADTVTEETGTDGGEGTLNTEVASGARAKRTKIKGNGKDTVTVMVYMCGTDLESRNGMATSDLQEMASANLGNINVIVYTGGCLSWRNNIVSSKVNQIYQVQNGGLKCLSSNAGTGAMTDPETLASFIKWCAKNYPANRNELIFWDHGGGSVSGYGYDEKNKRSGSMTLGGISKALKSGGVTFDMIGFDTCLMATAENALMLDSYGDYMVASEESEPGVGWYYTDWLTQFASDPSVSTTEIGKRICDDFVKVCARKCPGQQTTLSVIDLAEFAATVPAELSTFSDSITALIADKKYSQVSNARNRTREFASSSRIDQVDLIDLASNMGNEEGKRLIKALQGAIKYNVTNYISNASGVSIYFPYKSAGIVDSAVSTYNQIGMNASYIKAVQAFASVEAAGQAASGGYGSPLGSLFGFGNYAGSSSGSGYGSGYGTDYSSGYGSQYTQNNPYAQYGSTGATSDLIGELLGSFFGGDYSSLGFGRSTPSFVKENVLSEEETVSYIKDNFFDGSQLYWEDDENGHKVMSLSDEQWQMVHELDENLWYDDGERYVDLGLDNVYSFDKDGRLVADTSKAWLGVDGQVVAYYHESTFDDGTNYRITGYIPCLLNGNDAQLMVVFDNGTPDGYIAGVRSVYKEGETETAAKTLSGLTKGDEIQFVADCYDYDGVYEDSYRMGDPITYDGDLELMNVEVGDGKAQVTYRFTDIYDRAYWSAKIVL